jgi:hypothetical protein
MDQTDASLNNLINPKVIIKWIIITALSLMAGYVLKDKYAIVFILALIILIFTKHKSTAFFFFIIWVFTFKFFIGQGLITSKYFMQMEKLGYVIFLATFFQGIRECTNPFMRKILKIHLGFLIILILSFIINSYDFSRVFIRFTCFFIFILIVGSNFEKKDYINLLQLIFAIAIIQNLVSFMQYSGMIMPPRATFIGQVGTTDWVAGLNDSQCGTFGAVASNYVSWFLSLVSVFTMSYGLLRDKLIYMLFGLALLFQYAISESKTCLGTTIILFVLAFFRWIKNKQKYNINLSLVIRTFVIILVVGYVFMISWDKYYDSLKKSNVPKPEKIVTKSFDLVKDNPLEWGKVTGFGMVGKLQYEEYPLKVLFGFGVGEYEWSNREYYVLTRDVSIMSFNNFTNPRSSLIHYYAELGVFGFGLLIFLYIVVWQYFKNTEFKTNFGKTMQIIYAPFILASFVLGFIYQGLQFNNSFPIYTFWIFTALAVKFEMLENTPQNI